MGSLGVSAFVLFIAIGLSVFFPNARNALIGFQGDLQGNIKPAQWVPIIRNMHRFELELGIFELSQGNVVSVVQDAIKQSGLLLKNVINNKHGYEIVAHYYTPSAAWLDVVTLRVTMNERQNYVSIHGVGESTGVISLVVPFAPLMNIMLCYFPFDDWGNNKRYLTGIQRELKSLQNHNFDASPR